MISVVIPYMHTQERLRLLIECIKSIPDGPEICILEIGRKQHLRNLDNKCRYAFVKYDNDINHRGWALNLGVRKLSTGKKLILMDADIVVSPEWYEAVKKCDYPSAVAWGTMYYLDKESTDRFCKGDFSRQMTAEKIKYPSISGPAGGITLIDRKLFYDIKGVPENFENTWGGPDNTLFSKLETFGYPFRCLPIEVIHLWHSKNTPRVKRIASKARSMMRWPEQRWREELNKIGNNWGKE